MIIIKLDYTIETPEGRRELVEQILAETPEPNPAYLEILADYLVLCMEKQERKERRVLTENRMATISKRETSYEGLVSQLENGEDGIYNLITCDKNIIFQPRVTITQKDLDEIPQLRQLRDCINKWEQLQKRVSGRDAFIVKRTLIEMRKDQYVIKNAYRKPIIFTKITRSTGHYTKLPWDEWIDEDGAIKYSGLSFLNPDVVSILLQNFYKLKDHSREAFQGDTWYMIQDFEKLVEEALEEYPIYKRIVEYKQDARQNVEIQALLEKEFGFTHSLEYISSLWRNKIPKLIAAKATDQWLVWHYTFEEKGQWKKCTRCGEIKLAHSRFFSINRTSRDGWYSICKSCRNKKKRDEGGAKNAKL